MEKILEKIVSSVNYAGDTLMRSAVAKRVAACIRACTRRSSHSYCSFACHRS